MMRQRQAGFTIIEVIVALTILSLIMLALVTAMRTLGATQTKVQEVIDRTHEMRMVTRFLRRSISQAIPVRREGEEGKGTYFEGTDSELIWAAPISAGLTVGGLIIARISVNEGILSLQMQSFKSSSDKDAPDWEEIEKHILAEGVEQFTIGYRFDAGADWLEEWVRQRSSPRTVRLLLKKEGRFWPELIIGLGPGRLR